MEKSTHPPIKKMKTFHKFSKLRLLRDLNIFETFISFIFKIVGYFFGYLTCLRSLRFNGLVIQPQANKIQCHSYEENGELIYRRIDTKDGLLTDFNGIRTLTELILKVLNEGRERSIFGYRNIVKEHTITNKEETKVVWELSEYLWLSCDEVHRRIKTLVEFMTSLDLNQDRKIVMFAETSQDWITIAFAAMFIRSIIVTVYPTLTDSNLLSSLHLTRPVAILVDRNTSQRIFPLLGDANYIETIIYTSSCPPDIMGNTQFPSIKHVHVNTIYDRTPSIELKNESEPDNLVIIMFTSGTTGVPKGIRITHKNILSVMAACQNQKRFWTDVVFPGYLPLAHILEIMCEINIIVNGGKIGYANPSTLLFNGPKLYSGSVCDLKALKPTAIIFVPLILERVYKAMHEKFRTLGRVKQLLIQECYNLKAHFRSRGYATPILDKFFFKKFHEVFGGNLKFAMIGGACISRELEEFFNIFFPTFKQAYGSTENCCAGTFSDLEYFRPDNIGPPIACSELKLVPWPEGGFTESGTAIRTGEILISGPAVSAGYYKNEKEDENSFFVDPLTKKRWFRTADIGEVLGDGCFRIVGRRTEIIKLSHGEYIELVKVEAAISKSGYVDFTSVTTNPTKSFLIAVVSLNRQNVERLIEEWGQKKDRPFEELIQDQQIQKSITDDILKHITRAKLNKFEIPKNFIFVSDEWTPISGLVTPSMKINRKNVFAKYKEKIEEH